MHPAVLESIRKDISRFEQRWEESWFDDLQQGIKKPEDMLRYGDTMFLYSLEVGLPREKVLWFLDLFADLYAGHFLVSLNHGELIEMPMADNWINVVGESTTAFMDSDTWLEAFYASIIARRGNALKILCNVPEKAFLSANLASDEFDLALVRACKGLFDSSAPIGQLLIDAFLAHDRVREDRQFYTGNVNLPVLKLLSTMLSPDTQQEYPQHFQEALEDHRCFWMTDENYEVDEHAHKSLPLMAASVIAFDQFGLKLPVDTDLVPRWIVEEAGDLIPEPKSREETKDMRMVARMMLARKNKGSGA